MDSLVPRRRDRRGRGMRGPGVLPLTPGTVRPSSRERFDTIVLEAVSLVEDRWHAHLGLVDYAVEDTPLVPDHWDGPVPLGSLVTGSGATASRVVVFRRPVERRANTLPELRALVLTVVVEQIAELLNLPAEDVDPRS